VTDITTMQKDSDAGAPEMGSLQLESWSYFVCKCCVQLFRLTQDYYFVCHIL